jgi:hypothetical protein
VARSCQSEHGGSDGVEQVFTAKVEQGLSTNKLGRPNCQGRSGKDGDPRALAVDPRALVVTSLALEPRDQVVPNKALSPPPPPALNLSFSPSHKPPTPFPPTLFLCGSDPGVAPGWRFKVLSHDGWPPGHGPGNRDCDGPGELNNGSKLARR